MANKVRRVTLRLDEELYRRLSEKAARNDVSVGWLIRRAISESLGARPEPEPERQVASRLK